MSGLETFDQNLLKSLKNGDREAFRKVFDFYEKRLYYFIFSITKSEYSAEEILQEVFLKVWEKKEQINLSLSFNHFIYTIAKNLTYNFLRNVSNREMLKRAYWENITEFDRQTEDSIISADYDAILATILKDIPKQKRKIFILSRQQGKSNQEIADLLGISQKTVKNHLWNTLQMIKIQLQPYMADTILIILLLL